MLMNQFQEGHLMRGLRALCCAVAITACLAPGARADEYTKQTFLTFSGPIQLPGITLPAGTYQFRLADPESGRRTLQVWDKDGTKLFTTLLTIPDERMKPSDKPVVMFNEQPAGEAAAVRAWFYPNETYGQEFVYPKDQAMKIAKASHEPVLAFEDDAKDSSALKSAKLGRIDENGQVADNDKAASTTTAASASTTTADSASTTTADNRPAPASPMPSASRSDTSAPVGTSGAASTTSVSEQNRDNMPSNRAVGTSGQTPAPAAAPRQSLPRTASSATLIQLLAALAFVSALGVRVFRVRTAAAR
jgi:hypothetical protein